MNNFIYDKYIMSRLDDFVPGLSNRKEKELTNFLHLLGYLRQIIAGALAMLEGENIPEGLDFRMLELFRYCNGHTGIMKHTKHGLVCFPGTYAGELDAYGRGVKYVGALLNGEPMEGTIGVDCVVIPNNYIYMPDFPLFFSFAERLNEVDTSLDNNVFFTRLAPIIKVANGRIKAAVDEILKDINAGTLKCVVSDDLEQDIEGLKSIDIFNITDIKDVDKLQYLSKYHDDLLRRLYTYGGHAMAGTQKMAQQSSDEISQNDTISMIYPMERLKCLSDAIKEANELFGTNMNVHFSEPWTVAKEKIETSIANANQIQAGDATKGDATNENTEDNKDENIEQMD